MPVFYEYPGNQNTSAVISSHWFSTRQHNEISNITFGVRRLVISKLKRGKGFGVPGEDGEGSGAVTPAIESRTATPATPGDVQEEPAPLAAVRLHGRPSAFHLPVLTTRCSCLVSKPTASGFIRSVRINVRTS